MLVGTEQFWNDCPHSGTAVCLTRWFLLSMSGCVNSKHSWKALGHGIGSYNRALQCELHPEQKAALGKKLLHAMADIIEDSGAVRGGRVLRILGKKTRVPLLRFEETETGVVCDVSCTNEGPVFKSAMLRNVLEIDERAVHLVRLVSTYTDCTSPLYL